jgi:hypothetical protein
MAELPQCTAEQVAGVAEAVALAVDGVSAETVAEHLNHPQPAVESALLVGTHLGLVRNDGGAYTSATPFRFYFAEATGARRVDVLRFALEAFPAYRFFKQRVAMHRDPLRAARETKLRFDFANHESEVRETLVSLGQFTGSLTYDTETGYSVASSEEVEAFLGAAEQMATDGAAIEEFIRDRLGDEVYAYIQDEEEAVITHVRSTLQKVVAGEADRTAVVHIGNACENFLVKVAREATPAVDVSDATGVISKAQTLKDAHVITEKHMGYMRLVGQLRNAADHGEDADINQEWQITPEAVTLGALALVGAIKSIGVFVLAGRAEF